MSTTSRRWWQAAAIGAGVGGAYLAGVITGVVGSHDAHPQEPAAAASDSVLDSALDRISGSAAQTATREDLTRAAIEAMLHSVDDRWGRYLTPSEREVLDSGLDGRYSGIGVWLTSEAGHVVLSSVQDGSPAARAGLHADDEVVAIDGGDTVGSSLIDVARALRGAPGTPVLVEVARGTVRERFIVVRGESSPSTVATEQVARGIRLVRVSSFAREVGRQVRDAVAGGPSELSGIILDLRGNGGGLLTEAVEVASAFLDGGPVVSYETRSEGTRVLDAAAGGNTQTSLVVLVDGGTASAAEVVAAALQDRNRAVVIGTQTYGKGTVQEPATLPDGSTLELTVGTYRTPGGRVIDGIGVQPDLVVTDTGEAAVRRAVEVLRGLVASSGDRG